MKIVIDISEEVYNKAKDGMLGEIESMYICGAVTEGTVLPKGHGDLIDRDRLNLDYEVSMADDWKTAHEIANCVKYAPTVIEADKENK